ncbi:MAG: glycosyltransferase, partial [Verrucomicrobiales bacterium]|nr:glycosyltransferase [Verrucomicrobiales bacterium]
TDRLAAELASLDEVVVLTSRGVDTVRPFEVRAEIGNWHDAGGVLRQVRDAGRGGPVLWQYVPHMYGRGGVNLALGRVMRELARESVRQVVLAHEVAAPWCGFPHRFAYALVQRLMWRAVRRHASAIGISTEGWIPIWAPREHQAGRVFLAPSPSNLAVVDVGEREHHRRAWGRRLGWSGNDPVLGFFGSPGPGKQFDWVLSAWRTARAAIPGLALVVAGECAPPDLAPFEREAFRGLGYLPAREASEALQAMDLLALPFADGVSERRSSVMAGLAHGTPVLGTFGPATGPTLRASGAVSGVELRREVFERAAVGLLTDHERREQLGRRGREWYRAHADWPVLIQAVRKRLSEHRG